MHECGIRLTSFSNAGHGRTGTAVFSQIDFFKVNPVTRALESAGSVATANGLVPYAACMYHSPVSGKYYFFVNAQSGVTQQSERPPNLPERDPASAV